VTLLCIARGQNNNPKLAMVQNDEEYRTRVSLAREKSKRALAVDRRPVF
jgi:hypothetical protein